MDWNSLLHILSIILAVSGGLSSLAGWLMRNKAADRESKRAPPSQILTMLAYVLMSLSIFFFALRGLLFST